MSKRPVTKPPNKRKESVSASAPEPDDEPLLGGNEGESEDESLSLKEAFKQQYAPSAKRAVPESRTIKTSGGSQPTVAIEGMCLRVQHRTVGQGNLPQLAVDVIISKVRSNGAPDILISGTPGLDFLLPTFKPKKSDAQDANDSSPDGPSGASKDKKKEATPRTLVLPANHKTIAVGVGGLIQAAMFTMAGGGGKDKKKEGIDLIVPGMKVDVTGVVAGLTADGTGLYLNTSNIIALTDGVPPGHGPGLIIDFLKNSELAEGAAIRASMSMRGFHGVEMPPHLELQAQSLRRRWLEARDGMVSASEAKATSLRAENSTDMEAAALVMEDHASRLRSTNPADLAGGAYFFTPAKNPTPDYPSMNAAFVHEIAGMDFRAPKALMDFTMGGAERKALPEVFCVPEVVKCEFTPYNNVVIAHLRLQWMASKSVAIAHIKESKGQFTLDSVGAAVGIKVDLRTHLPPYTGIVGMAKGIDMAPDILKYGRWAIVTGINPKEPTDYDVAAPFNDGWSLDMKATACNIGIVVDEAFIKEHLCQGMPLFAYRNDEDLQVFKTKNKVTGEETDVPIPNLKLRKNGYQELTSQTYSFDEAEVPPDCTDKEYRVWFKGSADAILEAHGEGTVNLQENTEAGGKAVLAAAKESGLKTLKFLTERCAVYAIAF